MRIIQPTSVRREVTVSSTAQLVTSLPSGKHVYIQEGTYTLTSSITSIASGIRIEGKRGYSIIDGGTKAISVTGLQNVTFRGITFKNFAQIGIPSCSDITFEDCEFLNFITSGINLDVFSRVRITRCKFDTIGSNSVDRTWQGSGVYAKNGSELVVEDCEIARTYGHGGVFHIAVLNTRVERNKIHDVAYRGVHFFGGVSTGRVHDNDIWNCGLINSGTGEGCNGVYSSADTYGVIVTKNRIRDVCENGVEGQFGVIDDNIIERTGIDPVGRPSPTVSYEGIYPWMSSDPTKVIQIRRNHIKDSYYDGIKVYRTSDMANYTIMDNVIEDTALNSTYSGINLNSTVSYTNVTITGNTVRNKSSVVFLANKPCTNVTVSNNKSVNSGIILPSVRTMSTNDGSPSNLISNRDFAVWTTTTSIDSWTSSSATISQVADSNSYVPKLTVTSGGFPGRIMQTISMPKAPKIYILKVRFKGDDNLNIKVTPYLIDGTTLNNGSAQEVWSTYTTAELTADTMKELSLIISTGSIKSQIWIGTGSTAGKSVTIYSISEKLVMQ